MNYFTNEALPILDSFNDIHNIDKIINREGENFWETDWGNDKPLTLAHQFNVRRIIIAKLVKTSEQYKKFIEKIISLEEEKLLKLKQEEQYKNIKIEELFMPRVIKKIDIIM